MNAEQTHANIVVAEAFDHGVNYFDVAPSYGNAQSRLGPALEPYRKRSFLACKTNQRMKDGSAKELEESLRWLRTDHVDLYQIHGVTTKEDKGMAKTTWPEAEKKNHPNSKCWYQPAALPDEAALALRWALSQPVTAAVPPGERKYFRHALEVVQNFEPIKPEEEKTPMARAQGVEPIFHLANA